MGESLMPRPCTTCMGTQAVNEIEAQQGRSICGRPQVRVTRCVAVVIKHRPSQLPFQVPASHASHRISAKAVSALYDSRASATTASSTYSITHSQPLYTVRVA